MTEKEMQAAYQALNSEAKEFDENMLVVCEKFKMVYPAK